MPSAASDAVRGFRARNLGLIVPALMATSILVIVVPLPAALLDLLLSANITIAVMILLTTMHVRKPLDFSAFPSLLLGTTLVRLVLSIATTRLVLTRGAIDGADAAGKVVRVFAEFVSSGQMAVGLILFAILVAVQFLVITRGTTRISEVAARFALDGMPGRQMAIDADLQAGGITAETARQRRAEVSAQADFYAAMDGAGKFVRGDAVAGIVITLINIVGGLYVGIFEYEMDAGEAAGVFARLTIGDGLVMQLPAFLISLAAGLLVTRTSAESDLPGDIVGQLFVNPRALLVSAALLGGLSLTGLPRMPLLCLAGSLVAAAVLVSRNARQPIGPEEEHLPSAAQATASAPSQLEDDLRVTPIELELGFGLIRLVDAAAGGDLPARVGGIRHEIARELGIIVPNVRIRDAIRLGPRRYQVRIHDVPVAEGEIHPEGLLAIETAAMTGRLPGLAASDPAGRHPAVWIERNERERAERLGYRLVEPAAAVALHLAETVRRHGDELFSRQQMHELLQNLRRRASQLVDELIPGVLKPTQVHQVLCHLLRERVSIRGLEAILEALGDHADRTQNPVLLTEFVRQALARMICQQYRDRERVLRVVTLDPDIEESLVNDAAAGERALRNPLSPQAAEALIRSIADRIESLTTAGHPPVLLTNPAVRATVRQLTGAALPELAVLSLSEITRDTRVESWGQAGGETWQGGRSRSIPAAAA